MLKQAIGELYNEFPYEARLKYSGKFKPYRANVRLRGQNIQFNLSRKWKTVSKEMQIGLIQELLLKILKKRIAPLVDNTQSMQLYTIFMKKLHLGIPKTKIDPFLEESFDRVNEEYFYGLIEKPNLVWGAESFSKLGSYEYGSDTITITKALEDREMDLLDYVMYHEMLHKKHKFYTKNGRSYHHTREFRDKEKEFGNSVLIEKKLRNLSRKRKKGFFGFLSDI